MVDKVKNYCGKCGSKINSKTGLCPNCDIKSPVTKNGKNKIKKKVPKIVLSIIILLLCVVCAIGALAYYEVMDIPFVSKWIERQGLHNLKKVEVILPDDLEMVNDDFSTSESRKDFEEFILGESQEDEEAEYDLDVQISKFSKTEIIGKYNKSSTSVICKVTAADVYTYLMDNMDSLMNMETEELYQNIMAYIQSEECKMRTVEVEVPAELKEDKLVIDTTSAKYQDAVNGGMNSALTEIYVLWFMEMEKGE